MFSFIIYMYHNKILIIRQAYMYMPYNKCISETSHPRLLEQFWIQVKEQRLIHNSRYCFRHLGVPQDLRSQETSSVHGQYLPIECPLMLSAFRMSLPNGKNARNADNNGTLKFNSGQVLYLQNYFLLVQYATNNVFWMFNA